MKKTILKTFTLLLLTLTAIVLLASCSSVESISIKSPPDKTEYAINDPGPDLTGGAIDVLNTNGSRQTVNMDDSRVKVTGFDSSIAQDIVLTVTYRSKTATFTVTIKDDTVKPEPELLFILINTEPLKTDYTVGESIDLTEGAIDLHYDDMTVVAIPMDSDGVQVTYDFNTVGESEVIVSYKGFETSFTVTVNEPLPVSVSIFSLPNKKAYYIDESPDLTGGVLLVEYNNGSYEEISMTDGAINVYCDFTYAAHDVEVEVEYFSIKTSFTVIVGPRITMQDLCDTINSAWGNHMYMQYLEFSYKRYFIMDQIEIIYASENDQLINEYETSVMSLYELFQATCWYGWFSYTQSMDDPQFESFMRTASAVTYNFIKDSDYRNTQRFISEIEKSIVKYDNLDTDIQMLAFDYFNDFNQSYTDAQRYYYSLHMSADEIEVWARMYVAERMFKAFLLYSESYYLNSFKSEMNNCVTLYNALESHEAFDELFIDKYTFYKDIYKNLDDAHGILSYLANLYFVGVNQGRSFATHFDDMTMYAAYLRKFITEMDAVYLSGDESLIWLSENLTFFSRTLKDIYEEVGYEYSQILASLSPESLNLFFELLEIALQWFRTTDVFSINPDLTCDRADYPDFDADTELLYELIFHADAYIQYEIFQLSKYILEYIAYDHYAFVLSVPELRVFDYLYESRISFTSYLLGAININEFLGIFENCMYYYESLADSSNFDNYFCGYEYNYYFSLYDLHSESLPAEIRKLVHYINYEFYDAEIFLQLYYDTSLYIAYAVDYVNTVNQILESGDTQKINLLYTVTPDNFHTLMDFYSLLVTNIKEITDVLALYGQELVDPYMAFIDIVIKWLQSGADVWSNTYVNRTYYAEFDDDIELLLETLLYDVPLDLHIFLFAYTQIVSVELIYQHYEYVLNTEEITLFDSLFNSMLTYYFYTIGEASEEDFIQRMESAIKLYDKLSDKESFNAFICGGYYAKFKEIYEELTYTPPEPDWAFFESLLDAGITAINSENDSLYLYYWFAVEEEVAYFYSYIFWRVHFEINYLQKYQTFTSLANDQIKVMAPELFGQDNIDFITLYANIVYRFTNDGGYIASQDFADDLAALTDMYDAFNSNLKHAFMMRGAIRDSLLVYINITSVYYTSLMSEAEVEVYRLLYVAEVNYIEYELTGSSSSFNAFFYTMESAYEAYEGIDDKSTLNQYFGLKYQHYYDIYASYAYDEIPAEFTEIYNFINNEIANAQLFLLTYNDYTLFMVRYEILASMVNNILEGGDENLIAAFKLIIFEGYTLFDKHSEIKGVYDSYLNKTGCFADLYNQYMEIIRKYYAAGGFENSLDLLLYDTFDNDLEALNADFHLADEEKQYAFIGFADNTFMTINLFHYGHVLSSDAAEIYMNLHLARNDYLRYTFKDVALNVFIETMGACIEAYETLNDQSSFDALLSGEIYRYYLSIYTILVEYGEEPDWQNIAFLALNAKAAMNTSETGDNGKDTFFVYFWLLLIDARNEVLDTEVTVWIDYFNTTFGEDYTAFEAYTETRFADAPELFADSEIINVLYLLGNVAYKFTTDSGYRHTSEIFMTEAAALISAVKALSSLQRTVIFYTGLNDAYGLYIDSDTIYMEYVAYFPTGYTMYEYTIVWYLQMAILQYDFYCSGVEGAIDLFKSYMWTCEYFYSRDSIWGFGEMFEMHREEYEYYLNIYTQLI